jgi:hypothetical protein
MKRITTLIVSFALLGASPAYASSTCNAYNPQICNVNPSSQVASGSEGSESTTKTAGSSSLPFTGLDAALLVAGGLSLVGIGAVVRRVVGRQQH